MKQKTLKKQEGSHILEILVVAGIIIVVAIIVFKPQFSKLMEDVFTQIDGLIRNNLFTTGTPG